MKIILKGGIIFRKFRKIKKGFINRDRIINYNKKNTYNILNVENSGYKI